MEEIIDWDVGEVKAVSDTVWQLNNNLVILGINGVLNMLNNEWCQELGRLCYLAASRDVAVLQDVPEGVHKLAGQIVQKWWRPHGLPKAFRRLVAAHAVIVSYSGN
jgi:hypothetical protein